MKNYLVHNLIKFLFLFFISITIHAEGNESDSLLMESLDEVLIEEYKPCSDQSDISSMEVNTISSLMIVSEGSSFAEGEVVTSASGVQAIVDSYDVETQKLTYHQDANTGFETFLLNETITGASSGIAIVREFIIDLSIPCSESIVSIEEEPQQMIFTPKKSAEETKATAKSAAAEMMAEIEEELARQAALEAFQKKLAEEKAAAARSTAIYQARLLQDQMIKDRQAQLALEREIDEFEAKLEKELAFQEWYSNFLEYKAAEAALEKELAAFEAQLEAELVAADMMAEIIAEEERAKRLAEFQAKLEAEKAAAAASTAAYQAKFAEEKAAAAELAAFKAELAAHEECKAALNLSDSNIALFKTALAAGNLFSVGPQITAGTEFTANRWDDYASCIGALGYKNPF